MEQFYLTSVEELIALLYGEETTPRRIAGIYPIILEAAEEGDAVAEQLLENAASALVQSALAVIHKLKMEDDLSDRPLRGGFPQQHEDAQYLPATAAAHPRRPSYRTPSSPGSRRPARRAQGNRQSVTAVWRGCKTYSHAVPDTVAGNNPRTPQKTLRLRFCTTRSRALEVQAGGSSSRTEPANGASFAKCADCSKPTERLLA